MSREENFRFESFLFDHFIGSKFRISINAAAAEFVSLQAGDHRFCIFFAGVQQNEDPLRPSIESSLTQYCRMRTKLTVF